MLKHIAAYDEAHCCSKVYGYPARFRVYPATYRGYLAAARFRGHLAAAMCFSIRSNIFQQYIAADYSAFAAYVCLRMLTHAAARSIFLQSIPLSLVSLLKYADEWLN